LRTVKSCGPDAATLASSFAEADRAQPGGDAPISVKRRWQKSPFARESTRQAVKTIAQGEPDDAGKPVVTNSCVFYLTHEAAGVSDTRLSLRPLAFEGQEFGQASDASRRENAASRPLAGNWIFVVRAAALFHDDVVRTPRSRPERAMPTEAIRPVARHKPWYTVLYIQVLIGLF
jgi:hypothetical protein